MWLTKLMSGLVILTFGLLMGACALSPGSAKTIYLVRHAEKEPGRDPKLTPDGLIRAEALADYVSGAKLGAVFSTQFRRTRDTASPVAQRTGLPILYYDPSDLSGFADTLRAASGNVLVVGHSNTTPDLVTALGGDAGEPIVEATEYDRIYVLVLRGGEVKTELRRYGEPSAE